MNNKGLLSLALGTFALGISEFAMMGMLGALAHDLGITIPQAGHLISAYAAGVCCGAPALLFARSMDLKKLMLLLAALITAGNLMAALAPGYWWLMGARFISGLPHGGFFGVGAIVARKLAAQGRGASAVAVMIAGMTVATVVGVPAATFVTDTLSWRPVFAGVAVAGAATFMAMDRWIPRVSGLEDRGFRGQFRFLRTLPPWLIFGGVLLGQTGIYCWYSYIDPLLLHVSGFPAESLPTLMTIAGLGMFTGNLVAGRLGDRYKPSFVAAWVQLAAIPVLVAFFFLAPYKVPAAVLLFLGTFVLFGSGSPLQSDIVGYSRGGEMLGAACIQVAYNAGNAMAAWIGGQVIAMGCGYTAPAVAGCPLVVCGCVLLFILYRRYERE